MKKFIFVFGTIGIFLLWFVPVLLVKITGDETQAAWLVLISFITIAWGAVIYHKALDRY